MGKPNPAKNARKHMLAHMREKQAKERAQVRAAANVRLKSGPPQTQSQAASAAWPKPAKRNPYTKKRLAALAADVLPIWREGAQEIVGLFDWWDNIGQAKFEREHKARAKRLKRRLV